MGNLKLLNHLLPNFDHLHQDTIARNRHAQPHLLPSMRTNTFKRNNRYQTSGTDTYRKLEFFIRKVLGTMAAEFTTNIGTNPFALRHPIAFLSILFTIHLNNQCCPLIQN